MVLVQVPLQRVGALAGQLQVPPEQVSPLGQGIAVPYAPLDEHVATALPEHSVVPGTQLPMHVPPEQALFEQTVIVVPHTPLVLQVT